VKMIECIAQMLQKALFVETVHLMTEICPDYGPKANMGLITCAIIFLEAPLDNFSSHNISKGFLG
jgi:hypothetical protein